MRPSLLLAFLPLLAAAPLAQAQDTPPALPIHKTDSGTFFGHHIRYRTVIDTTAVPAPHAADAKTTKPGAELVSIAYLAKKHDAARPVIFAFNGGPIASSYGIQMGLLGPKHITPSADASAKVGKIRLKTNPYALLDAADLVFYDPAGTGFSKAVNGTKVQSYYNDMADAQELADFITAWKKQHHRDHAPVYIVGESYGTMRAALAAGILNKETNHGDLAGVILLGQAVNAVEYSQRPENIISFAVSLPTEAAVALHFKKISTNGKSEKDFLDAVYHFATTDYLAALAQGRTLPEAQKQKIADKLAAYTGIPASYYLAHDLKIRKFAFHSLLLKDSAKVTGVSDGSYSLPNSYKGDAAHIVNDTYVAAVNTLLEKDYGVTDAAASYIKMIGEKDIRGWTYAGTSNPFGFWPYQKSLTSAFTNPKFRLMILGGWYDLQTTMGAARYMVETSSWPADRVSYHFFPGGHMVYANPDSQKKVAAAMHAFIKAGK